MDGGIIFDVAIAFLPVGLALVALSGHRLWLTAIGLAIYVVAFIVVMLALGGCATRQEPGAWDAGLRHMLVHPCPADPADPWKRCE